MHKSKKLIFSGVEDCLTGRAMAGELESKKILLYILKQSTVHVNATLSASSATCVIAEH